MKTVVCVLWILSGLSPLALPQNIDFNGTWKLESQNAVAYGVLLPSQPPAADSEMIISYTGSKLLIESKCAKCGKPVREYIVDGTSREMPMQIGALIVYTARWDGATLIIDEGFGGKTPFGAAIVNSHQVWSLSDDKKTLTRSLSAHDAKGEVKSIDVYTRI